MPLSNVGFASLPSRTGTQGRSRARTRGLCCLAACAALGAFLAGCDAAPDEAAKRFPGANLILISLDTLRADALSMYGGADQASPVLAAFAREAVVFAHARSQSPHTAPSHMSLFTSLFPSVHGVQNVAVRERPARGQAPLIVRPMADTIPTLADVLAAKGYDTVGISNGGNLNPSHGFGNGFRSYSYFLRDLPAHIAKAREWLAHYAKTREAPFYFFWHTYEIHSPYLPPLEYAELFAADDYAGPLASRVGRFRSESSEADWGKEKWELADQFWLDKDSFDASDVQYLHGLYHGEVAYTDAKLGTLFAELRAGGLLDTSIVVVLSDHGEQFQEHGSFGHGEIYEEVLRVPLLIRLPGGAMGGRRIETPVALMDVMPTLLDLLEIDPASIPGLHMQGHSVAAAMLSGDEPEPHPITSELRSDREGSAVRYWWIAQYDNGLKLVRDGFSPSDELPVHFFDLAQDPDEQRDLRGSADPRAERLARYHRSWHVDMEASQPRNEGVAGEISPGMESELRKLGYIE